MRIHKGAIDPPGSKAYPHHLQLAQEDPRGELVVTCGATLLAAK